jgi:hypothetical protein
VYFALRMGVRRSTLVEMLSAVALLVAQGTGLLHLVSAQHGWCPAHGEPIEVTTPRDRDAAPREQLAGVHASIPADASDEHCQVLACQHRSIGVERAAAAVLLAPRTSPVSAHVDARAIAGSARYRLAPKTSPPA